MNTSAIKLYHYWRSTSSWRVRWALNYKEIPYQTIAVNLLNNESEAPDHLLRNPSGQVPTVELSENSPLRYLSESTAILEWIEEAYPNPALLPKNPMERARCRQLCQIINSGTQPLQNLGVAQLHSSDPAEQKKWNQFWIQNGLHNYEQLVKQSAGKYSMGDQFTWADLFLIPQCYNADRFEVALESFPNILKIRESAQALPSYFSSHPDRYAPSS